MFETIQKHTPVISVSFLIFPLIFGIGTTLAFTIHKNWAKNGQAMGMKASQGWGMIAGIAAGMIGGFAAAFVVGRVWGTVNNRLRVASAIPKA